MTKSATAKCKTPFNGSTPWQWNEVPIGGMPARDRCQSISTEAERLAAVKLIQAYRSQEKIAESNNIDARQAILDSPGKVKGIGVEMLRRELALCDHDKYLAAEEELTKLRQEAVELMKPFLKRLVASLDESLSASALEAEKRIEGEGLPICTPHSREKSTGSICDGATWTLHNDGVCQAFWYRRIKAEKVLETLDANNAVGATQFFLTGEQNTPFFWP